MQKENMRYGADDFQRYYSGEMPVHERHALEKASHDDPFLLDALEGFKYSAAPVSDIDELVKRLPQQSKRDRVVWLKSRQSNVFLKIAALFILMAGLTWLLNKNINRDDTDQLVTTEKKELPEISSTPESYKIDSVDGFIARPHADKSSKEKDILLPAAGDIAKDEQTEKRGFDNNFRLGQQPIERTPDSIKSDNAISVPRNAADGISKNLAGKVSGVVVNKVHVLQGKVRDQDGNPVALAKVADKKNNAEAITDKEGEFSLMSIDSAPDVQITKLGFQSISRELKADTASNNIILNNASNELAEVVVVGYGTKAKRGSVAAKKENSSIDIRRANLANAIPISSWESFYQYITDSLKTVGQLGQGAVKVDVELRFTLDKDGRPINITATKTLCAACETEAIHIMKGSPPLRLNSKRKKGTALIRF